MDKYTHKNQKEHREEVIANLSTVVQEKQFPFPYV